MQKTKEKERITAKPSASQNLRKYQPNTASLQPSSLFLCSSS